MFSPKFDIIQAPSNQAQPNHQPNHITNTKFFNKPQLLTSNVPTIQNLNNVTINQNKEVIVNNINKVKVNKNDAYYNLLYNNDDVESDLESIKYETEDDNSSSFTLDKGKIKDSLQINKNHIKNIIQSNMKVKEDVNLYTECNIGLNSKPVNLFNMNMPNNVKFLDNQPISGNNQINNIPHQKVEFSNQQQIQSKQPIQLIKSAQLFQPKTDQPLLFNFLRVIC